MLSDNLLSRDSGHHKECVSFGKADTDTLYRGSRNATEVTAYQCQRLGGKKGASGDREMPIIANSDTTLIQGGER